MLMCEIKLNQLLYKNPQLRNIPIRFFICSFIKEFAYILAG